MKINIEIETVSDLMGNYWGFIIKEDGIVECCGSANDFYTCSDTAFETLLELHKEKHGQTNK